MCQVWTLWTFKLMFRTPWLPWTLHPVGMCTGPDPFSPTVSGHLLPSTAIRWVSPEAQLPPSSRPGTSSCVPRLKRVRCTWQGLQEDPSLTEGRQPGVRMAQGAQGREKLWEPVWASGDCPQAAFFSWGWARWAAWKLIPFSSFLLTLCLTLPMSLIQAPVTSFLAPAFFLPDRAA